MAKTEKERRERNHQRRRAIQEIKGASSVVNNSVTPKEMIVQRTIKNAISVKDGIILPLSVRRKRKVKSIFWQKTVKVPRNRFCKLNKSRPLNPVVNDGLRRSALTVLEDVSNTRSVVSFFIHSFATQVTMPGTSSHLPRKVWVTVYKGDAYLAVNL